VEAEVTTLPTESALREMRARVEYDSYPYPDGQLALLDCALLMRRLEARELVRIHREPHGWYVRVAVGIHDDDVVERGPDLLTALAAALDRAEAGK
jgi:hypothetical protein